MRLIRKRTPKQRNEKTRPMSMTAGAKMRKKMKQKMK
jgi:hypothetical protein